MLVDAHCHLSELSPTDYDAVMTRAIAAGVKHFIVINAKATREDWLKTLAIAESRPDVSCAIAIHPHEAALATDALYHEVADLVATREKVRAVGEIGLDYHYMNSDRDTQRAVLSRFVKLAKAVKKPVIIHDRDCGTECVDILQAENAPAVGGMVHCFTGSLSLAQTYLELGFYVSFTGIITFKNAAELRAVVKAVPLDRLMIETDSPYLAPIPHRGKKNEPAFITHVADCVAEIKGLAREEVIRATGENAARFFQLDSLPR